MLGWRPFWRVGAPSYDRSWIRPCFGMNTYNGLEYTNSLGLFYFAKLHNILIYLLQVGFFGYMAFCDEAISGDILVNFRPTIFSEAVKLGFVMSVAVSFPLVIFPCRTSIHTLLFAKVRSLVWFVCEITKNCHELQIEYLLSLFKTRNR